MSLRKNLILNIFLVIIIFIFSIYLFKISLNIAKAEDITQFQKEIDTRNQQIADLQAEIDKYSQKVATTQEEANTLKKAIQKLESQKKDLENQISLNNLKIKNTEDDILTTINNINDNQDVISENRLAISNTLKEIYQDGYKDNFILNIIKAGEGGLGDFLNRVYNLTNFNQTLIEHINSVNEANNELKKNKNIYINQKDKLNNLSQDLINRQDIVKDNQAEQNSLLKDTKNEEANYQAIIKDRKSKVEDLQSEINDFESKIKYTLDQAKLSSAKNALAWPLTKHIITQYFGDTDFSATGAYNGHGHNGIDLAASVGTEVYSALDGVVMGIGDTDQACKKASYGKWVLIKHNNGLATLYGHLSVIDVKAGQSVSTGERIGLSGATGYVTGPHLHFTVIASDAVRIFGPTEYKSRVCGTYMVMPYAPLNAYLNPMNYLSN